MKCTGCGRANPADARFCGGCGNSLAPRCASCGAESAADARFCMACGASLAARPAEASGARKVVTIVFADLVGSTALHERLDAESARAFMESYYTAMRGAVESHGGTVTQLLGDGVKAVFGIPRVAEDDAIRAVRAAVAMQDAFRALAEQQRGAVGKTGLRVAVNTGEVVANDEAEIIGDPVNVAARLQEQGGDGDVVVGESTHRLVSALITLAPLGSFALKGRSEQVKAYRVESLERPAGAATTAFVGRDDEFARIAAGYEAAIAKPAAHLAVLLGSPGLGKSRLIDEFARRCGDTATVIAAHCDAAASATFAPLADALRECLAIEAGASGDALRAAVEAATPGDDADRARIASGIAALLAGSPASPEETFFVVRRFLAALATVRPVVLVIDDLHWAEPLLLDLIEHLVQWGVGVPLLVLVGARPELRDTRSSLATTGTLVADVVTLGGLDAGAAMRLAANVIGAADLPAAVAAKVLAASEGNPLFVGELVRMLVHEGALKKEGDRWTTGTALAALEMPPTIHALLAARIERLRPEERSVLERAAVVGRHFSRSAIAELLPRDVTDLDARLESLRRSELIERDTGWFLGEPGLRFHHVLIRDAAYRRLLKGTRAELHARFADWIEAKAPESVEHEETLGWHLEQAHQHLRELGPIDDKGRALGERAAEHLAAAGRRALARDDVPLAAGLLGRALDRLDPSDAARADLALDWCEALLAAGDVGPAAAAIDELGRFTAEDARLRAWHTCFVGQLTVMTAPQALLATADAVATAAAELTSLGDAAGEAKAHFVHAQAFARLGQVGACEAALDRALAAARRAGDRRRANTVLAVAPLAALWGPSPVTRASGRCLDVVRVLRITQGAPAVESVALSCQGVLEALRGRTDAARRMIASARKMVEELGITQRLLEADVFAARIELLEGDAAAAERGLRGAYEGLRDLGLGIDAARAAALLARALLALDRVDEAEALSRESEALAGDDLQASIAWRGARAEALARRGEHAAAVELASKAVEIAAATDALLYHADARLALAAALRAAGRGREAAAEERRATELWEAKGATLLADRTAHAAAPVAVSVAAAAPRAADAPRRRPVRPNFAFEEMRRAEAAVAARDARALEALYRRDVEIVDHQFGITYGYDAIVERVRVIIEESTESAFAHEPLAALGDSLALCRMRSTATGSTVHGIPVGATEVPYLLLIEADEQGSARNIEIFGDDKLADARVRLYQRYAERMPEGAERTRALAVAHSLTTLRSSEGADPDRLAPVLAPDFEGIDHRHLSNWSLRGAPAYIEHLRALRQVADDIVFRETDILALEPRAMLVATLHTGTARAGGGAYERAFLTIFVTDADGRLASAEWFDADREAEALARFDALTAEPVAPRSVQRRVRPNAATVMQARFDVALAARDFDALAAGFHENHQEIDHPTGSTYGRDACIASLQRLFRSRDPHYEVEPLATLGEFLVLVRRRAGASGATSSRYDVGAYENEAVQLFEVDERGLCWRSEVFAVDHLGDAIARLYERHAELLPEGPERERAATTARAVAAMVTASLEQDFAASIAPGFEAIDHRLVGHESVGAEELQRGFAAWRELTDAVQIRVDDVLALSSDALLRRSTNSGIVRASGGAFERSVLMLSAYGPDGRVTRTELFDADREAEALARFDALVTAPATPHAVARRVRPNAATAAIARFDAGCAARDLDAAAAQHRADFEETNHPTGSTYGLDGARDGLRRLMRAQDPHMAHEPLATLGDSLVLARRSTGASATAGGRFDVGAWAREEQIVAEVDANERLVSTEIFAGDRLGDAIVRLYERYAGSMRDGPEHDRTAATAHCYATLLGPPDFDMWDAVFAPAAELVDRRILGVGVLRGAEALRDYFRAMFELESFTIRVDEILGLEPHVLMIHATTIGTGRMSGGAFERSLVHIWFFGSDGLVSRVEFFDADREAAALARFDALVGCDTEVRAEPFANAAWRVLERGMHQLWAARDWDGILAMISPSMRMDDRRRLMRLEIGYEEFVVQFRMLFDQPGSHWRVSLLATRGERLSLHRTVFHAEVDGSGGPLAFDEHLSLTEVDADGRMIATVTFDLADEDAAYAELDARYEADASASHARIAIGFVGAIVRRNWDAVAALCSPRFVEHDHRSLAVLGTTRGAAAWTQNFRTLVELAPDTIYRSLHVRSAARGFLSVGTWQGTRDGGRYEIPLIAVLEVDERGAMARADLYDDDELDPARARFEELQSAAPSRFANTASRALDRMMEAWRARDWEGFARTLAPDYRVSDRRRLLQIEFDRRQAIEHTRQLGDMASTRVEAELLATRGDRLALSRLAVEVADGVVGPSSVDSLWLGETNERGEASYTARFDLDDLDAAYAELDARFDAGEGAAHPHVLGAIRALGRTWEDHDWDAFVACCVSGFAYRDHRLLGFGTILDDAAKWARSQQALVELAPDTRTRGDHLRISQRGALRQLTQLGTRDGGAFETPFFSNVAVEEGGRILGIDIYDIENFDEARAHFDALTTVAAPLPTSRFANAASRAMDRVKTALEARDWDAYARILAAGFRLSDRRRLVQLELDREQALEFARSVGGMASIHLQAELLATRGERLSLSRILFEGAEGDVGPSVIESLALVETNERGESIAWVRFDLEDQDAAYTELDARFEASEAGVHGNGWRALRTVHGAVARRDWDAVLAAVDPGLLVDDHRTLGWGTTLNSGALFVASQRSLAELAPDFQYRFDHVRTSSRGYLAQLAQVGTREGGAFESPFVYVAALDASGRPERFDLYDVEDVSRALARFDEVNAAAPSSVRFANAATRTVERAAAMFQARDWMGFAALFAAECRIDDRTALAQIETGRDEWLAAFRQMIELTSARPEPQVLATRGDRLVLFRMRWQGAAGDVGPSEVDWFLIAEVDARGDHVLVVSFEPTAQGAAYAELDARFAAGDGAAHPLAAQWLADYLRCFAARDWVAMRALFAPDLVGHNHRLVGWGTLHGPAALVSTLVSTLEAQIALAPDTQERVDHVRTCARGVLIEYAWHGTHEGGAFENVWLVLVELDEQGRARRADVWEAEQQGAARARFAELAAAVQPPSRFANAATRASDQCTAAWMDEDWERFAKGLPADFRMSDRRRLVQLELDREHFLAFARSLGERATTRLVNSEILATRGARLALLRWRIEIAGGDVGPSELVQLNLCETDEHGVLTAMVRWDADDLDAAYAELDARFEAGEGAAHRRVLASSVASNAAIRIRDWDALAALCAPTFFMRDHRLLGWGAMVQDAATFVRVIRSATELAPDSDYRHDHTRVCARGHFSAVTLRGTRDGGAFENAFLRVTEVDEQGRVRSHEVYEEGDFERALARFEEFRAKERRDPLAASVKPNLATASMERNWAMFEVLDLDAAQEALDAARAQFAPGFVWEDRRPIVGLSGGVDLMLASARERLASGARHERRTIVGTAGDRVAIARVLWAGGPPDGRFEVEFLVVCEVDEAGLNTAHIFFEPGDLRAAQREAWARWAAIDPVAAPWVELLTDLTDAWNGRDLARLRARLADDVVVEDHRLTGVGRIENADAYVDSNVVLWDLAPDQRVEFGWSWPALERHGIVVTLRREGTLADGGAFESEYVWLGLASGGRLTHLELFEIDHLDAALARFDELRPDPQGGRLESRAPRSEPKASEVDALAIPPNAATRSLAPITRLMANDDLDALRALVTDDFCFDDRTRRSLLRGGVEEWVGALQFMSRETRAHLDARLVATAGDRLALYHDVWQEAPGESRFRMESHRLIEIDAAGKVRAFVLFDANDRAAAHTELFERYVALGADGMPAAMIEFQRAMNDHDLARARAALPADFVLDDHRRTGLGRIDGADAYVASVAAVFELSPDARWDVLYYLAAAPHGFVSVNRMSGTNAEGGDFESPFVALLLRRDDRFEAGEMFEIDHLDAALASFEELRPDPLRIPPNAATRMRDRNRDAFVARDWDAIRALAGADFVFDDRGKRALVSGNVETWIASMEFTSQPGFRVENNIIGTLGDRIVLDRIRWFGKPDGDAFEFERVRLLEVGADGLLRAVLFFDPEDRFAASVEGIARFAAGEAAGSAGITPFIAFARALDARDWEATRECYAPDLVLVDHRPLSFGTLDREQWIASIQANDELSVGLTWDVFRVLAWNERGFAVGIRRLGTIPDGGGPFENELFTVALTGEGRIARYEIFDDVDAERAAARFEELCAVIAS